MGKWFTDEPLDVWDDLEDSMLRKVTRWIDRAETIIETKFPDITRRIEVGSLSAAAVAGVVEEMVTRAIDHEQRDGVESEQMPEWQVQYTSSAGLGKGSLLFLTTDEWSLLAPRSTGTRIGSIRMRRAHEVTDPTEHTP